MADYGMIGALGEGIKQGLMTYQETKKYKDEQALKQAADQRAQDTAQAGLLASGVQKDQNTGLMSFTPEQQTIRDASVAKAQNESDELTKPIPKELRDYYSKLSTVPGQAPIQIPEGMTQHQWEKNGLVLSKAEQTGAYGLLKAQASGATKNATLDERKNQNAAKAGQDFEHDSLLKQMKGSKNNLQRAEDLINGNQPITATTLNILKQDFINATAPGGAATEGKVNREMVDSGLELLNRMGQRMGSVKDLRTEEPEIFKNLAGLIKETKEAYARATEEQAYNIHQSYVGNENPKVKETIKEKLRMYAPNKYAEIYGGGSSGGGLVVTPGDAAAELKKRGVKVE